MEGETSTNKFSINNVRTIETSNGILSYPFEIPKVNTYEKLSKVEIRQIKKILSLKKKSSANLADLKMIVDGAGGFTYAKQKIDEFNHQALDAIVPYPDSPYKQSMVDLISFNVQRTG